jgi:hypothetical protein
MGDRRSVSIYPLVRRRRQKNASDMAPSRGDDDMMCKRDFLDWDWFGGKFGRGITVSSG